VTSACRNKLSSHLEGELFGHEKGAFTSASNRHKGKFEQVHEGTLFLDEVAKLSLTKLLRVIQAQEFQRVGGAEVINVDIRLIAASHQKLLERVDQGLFRMDLYYRLNVFPLEVPPLRDSLDDTPELVTSILLNINKKLVKKSQELAHKAWLNYKAIIGHTLAALDWKISGKHGAAKALGLPPSTLRSKMLKLGISRNT
jgi:hydrogenase-4 transcriptional activator